MIRAGWEGVDVERSVGQRALRTRMGPVELVRKVVWRLDWVNSWGAMAALLTRLFRLVGWESMVTLVDGGMDRWRLTGHISSRFPLLTL
jgi:hypothetical protein